MPDALLSKKVTLSLIYLNKVYFSKEDLKKSFLHLKYII